ncbi:ThuA domain-containing protein [Streptomyces sp. WAC 06738]|uniref:ThuA domain-containing protein n=1 Tax=Streptomyces sp. WAC 06738 TaxID=2203210 RepID=UPI001F0BDD65|nr:ThuA domain-containing protein [Streptomyces sp. WAC 06738]
MRYARQGVHRALLAVAAIGLVATSAVPAEAKSESKVLIYTGTTGYRHAGSIDGGIGPIQKALDQAGISSVREDCDGLGGAVGNCDHPDANPRVFTPENLAQYDAIFLFNSSSQWLGGGRPGPLWDEEQRAAIRGFVNAGGGIAANHNAVDMGAGVTTWDWWDGAADSAVGTLMTGHAASDLNNVATVRVEDRRHPSTRNLPKEFGFGDEHYNFARSVRGDAHVLATLDEETYEPGPNAMGEDHPISWCKQYDGGRIWVTGMGHFAESYTENGGNNNLVKHLTGGIGWAAGIGGGSKCTP